MQKNHSSHDHHNHHNHAMPMVPTTTMAISGHHHNHSMNMNMSSMSNNTSGGMGGGHGGHMHTGDGGMTDGHEGHMNGMGHMDMMKMYFHTGTKEYVLFESCHTDTTRDMVVACVVVFFIAILYEGLKFMREVLLQNTLRKRGHKYYPDTKMSAAGNGQEPVVIRVAPMSVVQQICNNSHAVQTFLHIVQVFISYCLMLVFMTYNAWLCIAVVLGAGVGYFIFGWKRATVVDANEHCH